MQIETYSGTPDKGKGRPPYKPPGPFTIIIALANMFLTSEKRTTSEIRTEAVPKCPLFGGSTVPSPTN